MRARSSHVVLAAGFAFFALTLSSAHTTAANIKEKRELLKQILFARFDFTEMAKRALGAHWRRRTPQEQEEFVRLFTEVLERAYADIIESYTDEKIVYVNERVDGTYADVGSKIFTAKGEEYSINYRAH